MSAQAGVSKDGRHPPPVIPAKAGIQCLRYYRKAYCVIVEGVRIGFANSHSVLNSFAFDTQFERCPESTVVHV